ncbi:MAG: ECF-type sigma factor [Planctomycetota bacterium]
MTTPAPKPPAETGGDATLLLQQVEQGDPRAAEALLPLVYQQLRAIAGSYFRGQRVDHTLQPTALVHEAYIKMIQAPADGWNDRTHFCAIAATAMRQILANHAEAKRAAKRGGDRGGARGDGAQRVPIEDITSPSGEQNIDLIELDDALRRLQQTDERLARIVELCFFGGLTQEQAADVMGVTRRTVVRGWRQARALLNVSLTNTT